MNASRHHYVTGMFSNKIEKVQAKVMIETETDLITGNMHMRPRLRLIDELISGEQFLAITDATVYDKSGNERFTTRFLSVNRDFVIFVTPWDDMEEKPDFESAGAPPTTYDR